MWYNDDDIESPQANWKNSEVTKLFVANYLDPMLAKEAMEVAKAEAEKQVEEEVPVVKAVLEHEVAELPSIESEFIHGIDTAIRKLARMAERSDNEIVRYKIERAIIDLEAKKQGDK
jgi:hypothetical protein